MFGKLFGTSNSYMQTLLRLVLGVVFFAHGTQKMLGWFGGAGFRGTMHFMTAQMGIPAVFAFLAIAAEFFGGLGLLFGFLGRIAAFGVACNMVVAIAMVNAQFGLFANWSGRQKGEGIEFHLLAIAMAMAIMVHGSGALSIDRLLTSKKDRGVPQPAAESAPHTSV
jgi:putative oxidoreductase